MCIFPTAMVTPITICAHLPTILAMLIRHHVFCKSLAASRCRIRHQTCASSSSSMFQVEATDGKARAGTLKTKHGSIQTPGCLLYTKKGSMLNLTPDMVAKLGPNAMHVDPMHLYVLP